MTPILGDVALWEAAVPGLALIVGGALGWALTKFVEALRLWLNLR